MLIAALNVKTRGQEKRRYTFLRLHDVIPRHGEHVALHDQDLQY